MSRRELRCVALLACLAIWGSLGCWEQIDDGDWFPQMKRQPAIQAFEEVVHRGRGQGFTPPDGTVPVGTSGRPDLAALSTVQQNMLENPIPPTLASLKNGEVLYGRYCSTCHGPGGEGDGAVAGPPFGTGPFGLVLPIGGSRSIAKAFSDGHIYATISLGRGRMPNYRRIPADGRWDLVNFIRELNRQGGR